MGLYAYALKKGAADVINGLNIIVSLKLMSCFILFDDFLWVNMKLK